MELERLRAAAAADVKAYGRLMYIRDQLCWVYNGNVYSYDIVTDTHGGFLWRLADPVEEAARADPVEEEAEADPVEVLPCARG